MVTEQKDMRVPSGLLPKCPVCGKPLTMNLRSDNKFVEDRGWHKASKRYYDFLHCHKNSHVLLLELGVGYNTPGIIKYPFWDITAQNTKAVYTCINYGEATCPAEIEKQAICINGDIWETLQILSKQSEKGDINNLEIP